MKYIDLFNKNADKTIVLTQTTPLRYSGTQMVGKLVFNRNSIACLINKYANQRDLIFSEIVMIDKNYNKLPFDINDEIDISIISKNAQRKYKHHISNKRYDRCLSLLCKCLGVTFTVVIEDSMCNMYQLSKVETSIYCDSYTDESEYANLVKELNKAKYTLKSLQLETSAIVNKISSLRYTLENRFSHKLNNKK